MGTNYFLVPKEILSELIKKAKLYDSISDKIEALIDEIKRDNNGDLDSLAENIQSCFIYMPPQFNDRDPRFIHIGKANSINNLFVWNFYPVELEKKTENCIIVHEEWDPVNSPDGNFTLKEFTERVLTGRIYETKYAGKNIVFR